MSGTYILKYNYPIPNIKDTENHLTIPTFLPTTGSGLDRQCSPSDIPSTKNTGFKGAITQDYPNRAMSILPPNSHNQIKHTAQRHLCKSIMYMPPPSSPKKLTSAQLAVSHPLNLQHHRNFFLPQPFFPIFYPPHSVHPKYTSPATLLFY